MNKNGYEMLLDQIEDLNGKEDSLNYLVVYRQRYDHETKWEYGSTILYVENGGESASALDDFWEGQQNVELLFDWPLEYVYKLIEFIMGHLNVFDGAELLDLRSEIYNP